METGYDISSKRPPRMLALAMVVFLGTLGILVTSVLAKPTSIAAEASLPVRSISAKSAIDASVELTYQLYLPLVVKRYNANSAFGVQLYGSLSPSTGFTYAVQAHAGWLRFPVYWSTIEPTNTTPDNYNWSSLDASVQAVQNSNIQPIFTLERNPAWAAAKSDGPVSNTADLLEFMGALVARYPSVHYWEIYNEPDSIQRFGRQGKVYAALLDKLYPVIKSANSQAQVVLGGLAMDWFIDGGGPFDRNFITDVLTSCTGPCFDVANFHYYPFYRGTWEPYGHDIIGKANFLSQTLVAHHVVRPLIASETGWPSGTGWGSPELAARYVPKSFSRALAAGLSTTIWFAMLDADTSNPGLLNSFDVPGQLVARPAYTAFLALTNLLNGAKYLGAASVPYPLEGYRFSTDRRIDVYWYDCPLMQAPLPDGPRDCTSTATLQLTATRVGVIDKFGTETIKTDGSDGVLDGKITLSVGSSPIYIDYSP